MYSDTVHLYSVKSRTQEAKYVESWPNIQSTQSDGPVHFFIFCSISISLLASLVAGRRPQCNAGAD